METRETLEKFLNLVRNIRTSKFIQETKSINYSLIVSDFDTGKSVLSGFDEDFFRSVLLDIRKLYQQKEDTNIEKIIHLVSDTTNDASLKKVMEDCKNVYYSILHDTPFVFIINNEKQTPKNILENWLYGHYFHGDQNKSTFLKNLGLSTGMHRLQLVHIILNLYRLSEVVAHNIEKMMRTEKKIEDV